jgi:hypothetical protein
MPPTDLDPLSRQFLDTLYAQTGDDADAQISMYDLGASIGQERDQSRITAEDLMAEGLLEIRTLSGGVALSEAGRALFNKNKAAKTAAEDNRLGQNTPLDQRQRDLVDTTLTRFKSEIGDQELAYEALTEIMADIRTIEAQLVSPRAKTPVVRACLEGLRELAGPQWQKRLAAVLR